MTPTLEMLAREQQELPLPRFDYEIAWQLGSAMREEAAAQALPVAITIAHGTELVMSVLMPGATPDNLSWAARKRAVAHRFHRSSLAIRLEAEKGGYDLNAVFALPAGDYVASGGAVPLMLQGGTLIGTAAVSGLPDVEDHAMVVRALRRVIAA
ncbi:heme-degrading domain-containing protein [Wenxinia saemankumensis]|uniref:Uncharacterized protein, UPF0303 family n=1 Tax=Wenxinia saemankumensis TaxID=1447782 RepID=A0A1M6GZ28_9RHOB|nr:heme-binding protein [Wenxinia saemankumensis]SHJ15115.1 Uncharacterized protein, UPF0303 family [Wenxinia saemankumensis]